MRKISYFLTTLFLLIPAQFSFAERQLSVVIEGITNKKALENAQNATELYQLNGKEAPSDLRIQWLYEEGAKEIIDALQPYGYYRADVKGNLLYEGNTVKVVYQVTPNERIPIGELNLGITDLDAIKTRPTKEAMSEYQAFDSILTSTKMKVGAPLNHTQYESTKSKLSQKASELGYFDAYYPEHQILVNLDDYKAYIDLEMTLGERYVFGNTTFHQEYFDNAFLERFLIGMKESNDYSDQKLVKLQSSFNESNYFEDAVIVPKINAQDKDVPLDIYLRLRKQRTLTLGLGYSSDIGLKTMGGMTWHYVNPYGHRLVTSFLLAQKKRDALINYQIPGTDPLKDQYNIFAKYDYEDTSTKDYTTYMVGVSKERIREQYKYGYSLHYQYDKFRDFDGSKQNSRYLVPTIYGEWKTAPVIPFDQFGLIIDGQLRGASGKVLSTTTFLQAQLGATAFVPLGENNRFILRGAAGYTKIRDRDIPRLPPSLRFYAGGDNSVRGYKYDGIGDKGYNGDIYGGKKLIVGSVEYEHKIIPSLSVVAFVDAGDAYNSKLELKYGAGAGVRWYSPIGTVKLDLAHGFDKEYGDTIRLHLNINSEL